MKNTTWYSLLSTFVPSEMELTQSGLASEVLKTKDAFVWRLELPGFDASQVEVSVLQSVLLLKVKASKSVEEAFHFSSELKLVQETLLLTNQVDTSKVTSEMKNGVLMVTLPLMPKEFPRKVEVRG